MSLLLALGFRPRPVDTTVYYSIGYDPSLRTWTVSRSILLIGQDKLPTGARHYDLTPVGSEPNPRRSWEYWYNENLIGKDVLPFKGLYELPPVDYSPEPNFRRSWERWYTLNLIGQDKLPFFNKDWPNPPPVYWYRSWEVYQLNELELEVPFRQYDWPNPPPVQWYAWWFNPSILEQELLRPVGMQIWPDPYPIIPSIYYRSWEAFYNQNLIGKDKLPFFNRDWPNPKDYQRLSDYTWIGVSGISFLPFNKFDWPNPYPAQWYRSWEYWYNLDLINQDRLPNRQQDWPNPYPVQWYQHWENWYDYNLINQDKLPNRQQDWPNPYPVQWYQDFSQGFSLFRGGLVRQPFQFSQYDWPVPKDYLRIDETWTYTFLPELIGKDQLPNRQQDWPNPPPVYWYRGLEEWYNLNLIGRDKLPIRQQDWPLVRDYLRSLDYTWIQSPAGILAVPFSQLTWPLPAGWQVLPQDYFWSSEGPEEIVIIVPEIHFKPHLISMGRMGALGGLS